MAIRIDPTSTGDMRATLVRRWYEVNRETWWDRHRQGAYRKGASADEWIIGLMNEVARIGNLSDRVLYEEHYG